MIERTIDYDIFKTNKLQPKSRAKANSKLIESIRMTKGNEFVPALVSSNMEIIDGHRRLEACIISGAEFFFIVTDDNLPQSFIHGLNSTSKQWTTIDYICSYSEYDDDYKMLYNFIKEHKIPVEAIKSFSGYSGAMLKSGCKIKINYKDLRSKIKIFGVLKGLFYPAVGQNQIHRGLASIYNDKGFNDYEFLKKVIKLNRGEFKTENDVQRKFVEELRKINKG